MIWEYAVRKWEDLIARGLEKTLREYGQDRWELVSITQYGLVIFKRTYNGETNAKASEQ